MLHPMTHAPNAALPPHHHADVLPPKTLYSMTPEGCHCHPHSALGREHVSLLPCCCFCDHLLIRHYPPAGNRTPTSTLMWGRTCTTVDRMPTGAACHQQQQCAGLFHWCMRATVAAMRIPHAQSCPPPNQGRGGGTAGMAGTPNVNAHSWS